MSKLELTKIVINDFGYASIDRKNLEAIEDKIRADERKKVLDEVIEIARAEIDFENQAEQIRFVEFMGELKKGEQK